MKNLTWQNPEQLFVAQELINKVKSKCCGIKVYQDERGNDLHGKVQLIVAKNRMGDLGECYVNFNPSTGLMTEASDEILGDGGNVNKKKDDSIPPPPSANGTLPF